MASPQPKVEVRFEPFSFSNALVRMLEGKKVSRIEWDSKNDYGLMDGEVLKIHKANDPYDVHHNWIVSKGDMEANDWIVVE